MAGHVPEGIEDALVEADAERRRAATGADGAEVGDGAAASAASAALPRLGPVGWARWAWRQLTSMRVALLLLLLLAVAAVPGSIVPQRPRDPAAVAQFLADHPGTGPWLDRLGFFDVYASAWFSAVYLLLFVSLVGCILPRTRLHLRSVRARPPRAPRRFDRFPARAAGTSERSPQEVARAAAGALRGRAWWPRFRVDVHEEPGHAWSVAAERGYLRETGNIVFHLALVGLLVSVAVGQLLHYRGQAIIVEGRGFANAQTDYDTFEAGSWFDAADLVPFTLTLDRFDARFDPVTSAARDFTAHVTVAEPGSAAQARTIKVNHPLDAGGAKVYLQGNGYAPRLTVRDAAGAVAFSGAVPFLPQDATYASRGVVKVPDVTGGQPQIGLQGDLLPTARRSPDSTWTSAGPQADDPALVLSVWSGDLGLDDGVPQNVYRLDQSGLVRSVDSAGAPVTLVIRPGQTVELPDGLGSLTFEDLPRFVALDLRHDPSLVWVLVFALTAAAGLAVSLFVPRRRIWVRAVPGQDESPTVVTGAALARGDDLGLQAQLDEVMTAIAAPADGVRSPDPGSRVRQEAADHDAR